MVLDSRGFLVCLALLVSTASAAEESADASPMPIVGGSVGVGVGTAYAGLGVQFQVRLSHLGLFTSLPMSGNLPWHAPTACNGETDAASARWGAGARWYVHPDRGPYVSGNWFQYRACNAGTSAGTLVSLQFYSLLAGWRFRWGPAYLDVALGPAVAHEKYECTYCQQRILSSGVTAGIPSPSETGPVGNGEIGVGLAF